MLILDSWRWFQDVVDVLLIKCCMSKCHQGKWNRCSSLITLLTLGRRICLVRSIFWMGFYFNSTSHLLWQKPFSALGQGLDQCGSVKLLSFIQFLNAILLQLNTLLMHFCVRHYRWRVTDHWGLERLFAWSW